MNPNAWQRASGMLAPFRLRLAFLAFAALLLAATRTRVDAQETVLPSLLTNAQQVLDLGNESARRAPRPARLRAVVTWPILHRPWFYAQDDTAGILIVCRNGSEQPSVGDLVEIAGVTEGGLQAPLVTDADYKLVGHAPLPTPHHADPDRLLVGEEFGQWISLDGYVLDYLVHPEQLSLLLQRGDHHFVVNIRLSEPMAMPAGWLGARIEAQGVCWTETRANVQPKNFRIQAPGTNAITVLQSGPADLFALPVASASSLGNRPNGGDQRVRVVGTVSLFLPDQGLFLRDDTGPIQAQMLKPITTEPYSWSINSMTLIDNFDTDLSWTNLARRRPYMTPVRPGDRVEVVGTPSAFGLGVFLADAEYRRVGSGAPPEPTQVAASDLLSGQHEGDLVKVRGRLVDRETHQTADAVEDLLVLRDGNTTVQVLFTAKRAGPLPVFPRNALLEVTGVCSTEKTGEWKAIRDIRVLVRGSNDVRVVDQPPPWESWQVGRLLIVGGTLGIGALAWIGFLRHRVARRTAELAMSNRQLVAEVEERKRAQSELSRALAAEKELNQLKSRFVSMVSHEFRTPLGVILSSADLLSDYLETLSPEERAEQIADIKKSTRHMAALMEDVLLLGRVESGRMGYHPDDFDLPDFCRRLVDEMLSVTNSRCPVEFVEKGIDATARGDETLLRHMLHNVLSNGVKYSAPGESVQLRVEREGDDAVFKVSDRGIGMSAEDQKHAFDAFFRGKNVGERPGTGLGLVVVKRCVELHGGTVTLQSTEGQGTTITVRLPLFRAPGQTERFFATSEAPATQPL